MDKIENCKGILIDLDGVVYERGQAIAGAIDVIKSLKENNFPHLFVTNTTSKPRHVIVEKLHSMGVQVAEKSILTPAVAAVSWIHTNHAEPASLFIPDATLEDFSDIKQSNINIAPKCVVMGDLGERWNFNLLNTIFRQLKDFRDVKLLALGMTRYWRAENGLRLDVGPFVKAMEFASDCEVIVLGKPAPMFFTQAANMLGVPMELLAMIGDDIQSDVLAAQVLNIQGILVKTGKFTEQDLKNKNKPNFIIDSIANLPELLRLK